MQPVRRTQGFTNGEATFGGPPGGFVWSVQLNVPTAQNSDTFQLYINGEQLTSTTGTGLMGPVQVFNGETVTIKSSTVAAGTKAFLYGQVDKQGQQPSGIFPAISGGVVTTTATTLNTQSLLLGANVPLATNTDTLILTDSFAAGTWLITFFGYIFNSTPASFQASLRMTTGTAAATFDNKGEAAAGASFTDTVPSAYLTRSSVVIVSSAGSLIMKAYANYTSQVNANDPVTSYPVTGYTALQIA